jgi:hypothetical protein
MHNRMTCPVDGCIKRGTKSALAQHAKAVHPAIARTLYERAVLAGLHLDQSGRLLNRPRRRTLWHRPKRTTRLLTRANWASRIFYGLSFVLIGFLYLAKYHNIF